MTRRGDLDESAAREAVALLDAHHAAYSALLLELNECPLVPADPDRLRELTIATGRILHPLRSRTEALAALAGRLRRPGCVGPRADAARNRFNEVGAQVAEAGACLDRAIGALRADQGRTLEEVAELSRTTPIPYQTATFGSALLVDRTG
jgi:hypothetical protein